MKCGQCGCDVRPGEKFCGSCGAPIPAQYQTTAPTNNTQNQSSSQYTYSSPSGNVSGGGPSYTGGIKTDRSLLVYILLGIVTCGIYHFYFVYSMSRDVNIMCEGDGEHTAGLLPYLLLGIVTCGLYSFYWYYRLGNRLAENSHRYGMNFQENGTTVLLWATFGCLLCGLGFFMAWHILIKNTNRLAMVYNQNL